MGQLNEDAKGVYVISATPFLEDGALDQEGTPQLIDFYLGCGVAGITILGVMGEATMITEAEAAAFVERVIGCVDGRVPVIVGVTSTALSVITALTAKSNRISMTDFVALSATNAAKLYGLYPRKGTVAVGADGDLVIWDDTRETTVSVDMLHENMDYTPYEGMTLRGWPTTVISRGEVVVEDGDVRADRGRGQFLPCDLPDAAKPRGLGLAATKGFDPTTGVLHTG